MKLQAYCSRIAYSGPIEPTLDVLREIAQRHPSSIVFENLSPLTRQTVDISPEALEEKLVCGGRGGYCYEQNSLLRDALQTMGFKVSGLSARVVFMRPDDSLPPRSHMLLRVDLDDQVYIIDGGFGGATPTAPLELVPDVEQKTPHEPYRLQQKHGEWLLSVLKNGSWEPMYQFDLQPQLPPDYVFPNYYLSTHPASHFVNNLIAARPVQGGRYTMNNAQLSYHPVAEPPQRQQLSSPDEVITALNDIFGIATDNLPGLESSLARLFAETPA